MCIFPSGKNGGRETPQIVSGSLRGGKRCPSEPFVRTLHQAAFLSHFFLRVEFPKLPSYYGPRDPVKPSHLSFVEVDGGGRAPKRNPIQVPDRWDGSTTTSTQLLV